MSEPSLFTPHIAWSDEPGMPFPLWEDCACGVGVTHEKGAGRGLAGDLRDAGGREVYGHVGGREGGAESRGIA